MEDLLKKQKKIIFSGAGSSHKNGAAESDIKTSVTMERTMLMHATIRCPENLFSYDIWQLKMDYAVCV